LEPSTDCDPSFELVTARFARSLALTCPFLIELETTEFFGAFWIAYAVPPRATKRASRPIRLERTNRIG